MAENRIIQIYISHKIAMLHNVSLKVISVWTKVSYNAVQEVSKWLFLSQATTRGQRHPVCPYSIAMHIKTNSSMY